MLRVLFNGKELVLTNSTVINYTIKSPVFNTRDGAAVYKFKVSDCPENHQVFAFQFRQERFKTETVKGTLDIVFGSTTIFSGIGYAVGMKKGEIEITGGIGKGELYSNFKDTYLDEIELGNEVLIDSAPLIADYVDAYRADRPFVVFPLYNPGYYQGYVSAFSSNQYQNPVRVSLSPTYHFKVSLFEGAIITPFFYVAHIIKSLFEAMGMELYYSDLLVDSEYMNLCQYTPIAAGEFTNGSNSFPLVIRTRDYMPHVKVLDYIKAIEYKFNFFHFSNPSTRKVKGVSFRKMLESNDFISWDNSFSANPEFDYQESQAINLEYKLDSTDTLFGSRVTSIYANDKRILPPVNNTSELAAGEQGHLIVRYNRQTLRWHICRIDPATGAWTWPVYSWDFQDYKLAGDSREPINIKTLASGMVNELCTVALNGDPFLGTDNIYLPATSQPGYSYVHWKYNSLTNEPISKPDFGIRLMIYRGMRPSTNDSIPYPYGSSDVYHQGPTGLEKMEDANKAIRFQNEYGLVENEYATTLAWLKSRQPATFYRRFTVAELVNLDMSMKYRIDRQDYILEEVSGAIGHEGLRPAKVKAWKAL